MSPLSLRDQERLIGVHSTLIAAIRQIISQLPMFVICGVRTQAEQAALYAQGRTQPGKIVTNDDGTILRSNHEPHSDGLGYAVDCAWLGGEPFGLLHDWTLYGAAVEAQGLIWGGRWPHLVDMPHAELKANLP